MRRRVHRVHRLVRHHFKERRIRRALAGQHANLDDIARFCARHAFKIEYPLLLISQVQRSGGTLLSQLFDGHPQLLAHPHELKIGHPRKYNWPDVRVDDGPEVAFDVLFERISVQLMTSGYTKGRHQDRRFPFFLVPSVQRAVFMATWDEAPPRDERAVLDIYMTSYFNAWLNHQGALNGRKFVSGFTPMLSDDPANVERFFQVYPDGRLCSVVRSPSSWFPSARRHEPKRHIFGTLETALGYWRRSAESMLANKARYPDRVVLIRFDHLVRDSQPTLTRICGLLGIDFDASLLIPTFNGLPMRANSSFSIEPTGIVSEAVSRERYLSDQERRYIRDNAEPFYEQVLEHVDA